MSGYLKDSAGTPNDRRVATFVGAPFGWRSRRIDQLKGEHHFAEGPPENDTPIVLSIFSEHVSFPVERQMQGSQFESSFQSSAASPRLFELFAVCAPKK